MTVVADLELEELAESSIRHFLASESGRRSARNDKIKAGIGTAVMAALITHELPPGIILVATAVAVILGVAASHFLYSPIVRRRMIKYIKTEHGDQLPARTTYSVDESDLNYEGLGSTLTIPLDKLRATSDDETYLDLDFGKTGRVTIPLRAFASDREKAEFVSKLKSSQK